ncbi:MAG: XRE family transcriptional regulator [Candidatus Hydrogenedentes bacterium]|nr:XRE family transcriptional regulator [Candidatus Hydrogenedentota bacterium]MBI3119973.1 XRE family transcriptional regulator [Candidatus Hydrogenedentota bacterium]
MREGVIDSSGNVFLDLGYPPDEAAILQMRATLLADLRQFLSAKRLGPARAAKLLRISPARATDLIGGRWEKFSLEMLVVLATRAGMQVSVKTAA